MNYSVCFCSNIATRHGKQVVRVEVHLRNRKIGVVKRKKPKFIERRENPFGAGSGKHEHHDNPKLIVDLLRECKVFIARNIGPDSKKKLLKKFGITVILTDVDETEKALKEFLKSNGKSNTTK